MRLDHPIFKTPLDPKIELEDMDTPKGYDSHPVGKAMGKSIKAWKVQDGEFPKDVDFGLVSDPYGFEDSADAEWISSGVNTKGPLSVALGRHGNLFLWGFSADPRQMTESGKRVFLNALHYMNGFDGHKRLVEKRSRSRDWVQAWLGAVRKDPKSDRYKAYFPGDVRQETGMDPDKLEAYYKENFEFLRLEGRHYVVDTELKELGVSNRKPEFLDKLIARLEKDEDDELAQNLWDRYLPWGTRSTSSRRGSRSTAPRSSSAT